MKAIRAHERPSRRIHAGLACAAMGLFLTMCPRALALEIWNFKDPAQNPMQLTEEQQKKFKGYFIPGKDVKRFRACDDNKEYTTLLDDDHPDGSKFGGNHQGIDIIGWVDENCHIWLFKGGEGVRPTRTGNVVDVDNKDNGHVHIDQGPPLNSNIDRYEHLKPSVTGGDQATKDTVLGKLYTWKPEDKTFNHLHYGEKRDDKWVDPMRKGGDMKKENLTCGVACNVTPREGSWAYSQAVTAREDTYSFHVMTGDPDPAHYTSWTVPLGWAFDVSGSWMSYWDASGSNPIRAGETATLEFICTTSPTADRGYWRATSAGSPDPYAGDISVKGPGILDHFNSPSPEPCSLLLFGSGLSGLIALQRKRRPQRRA